MSAIGAAVRIMTVSAVICVVAGQQASGDPLTTTEAVSLTTSTTTTTTTTAAPVVTCPAPSPCSCSVYSDRHVKCTDQGLSEYSEAMYTNNWHLDLVISRLDMSRNQLKRLHQNFLLSMKGLETALFDKNQFSAPLSNQASNSLKNLFLVRNVVKLGNDKMIGNFPRLEELNLSWNQVDRVTLDTFRYVPKLKVLSLEKNHLTVIREDVFSLLVNLVKLNLAHNQINTLNRQSFAGLLALKSLRIDGNALEVLSDGLFVDLQRLETLDASHNFIHVLSARCFDGLRHLKILRLSSNKIASLPSTTFQFTPVLSDVYLGHNLIRELHIQTFEVVKKTLVKLNISENKLGSVHCGFFQQLVALRSLAFEGHMTERLPNVTNMRQLRELYISRSLIKSMHVCELQGLVVSDINWDQTMLQCDCNLAHMANHFSAEGINILWEFDRWCESTLTELKEDGNCTGDEEDAVFNEFCKNNPCLSSNDESGEIPSHTSVTAPVTTTVSPQMDIVSVGCSREFCPPTVEILNMWIHDEYVNISWVLSNLPQNRLKKISPTSYTISWGESVPKQKVRMITASSVSGEVETYQFARKENQKKFRVCISAAAGDTHLTMKCLEMTAPITSGLNIPFWISIVIGLAVAVLVTIIVMLLVWKCQNRQRHYHTDARRDYQNASFSNQNQGLEFVNPNGVGPALVDPMGYEESK